MEQIAQVRKNFRGSAAGIGSAEVSERVGRVAKSLGTAVGDGGEAVTEKIAGTDGIRKHGDSRQARLRARLNEPFSASIFF